MSTLDELEFTYPHALGCIRIRIGPRGVRQMDLGPESCAPGAKPLERGGAAVAGEVRDCLDRYFAGEPEGFARIPLDLDSHTAFRRAVWEAAREISWGEVATYGDLCALLGRGRGSARAVGQALGANPIPIIIPCHRVLASNGELGGFSCGLRWKRALLEVEGRRVQSIAG